MGLYTYALNIYLKAPRGVPKLAFIGGGCFRSYYDGTPVKDYDLFFRSYEDWLAACEMFRSDERFTETTREGEQTYPSFQSPGDPPFNLIGFRFYPTATDLRMSFDFTCVATVAATCPAYGVSIHQHPNAAYDASNRRLEFQNLQHIDRVKRRMARYEDYGYVPTADFIDKLPLCRDVPRGSGGEY